jgi:hypothetical protein
MISHRCLFSAALLCIIIAGMTQNSFAEESGKTFVAAPPYAPEVAGVPQFFDLAGKVRNFDFGGDAPFVNASTGISDIATINVWDPVTNRAITLTSSKIGISGVKKRVFKEDGYTAIGYVGGDGIVEGKLRTQINSFPIPSRKRFAWDLSFRLGGGGLNSPWVFTPKGVAPAGLWQLKTVGLPPTLVMAVDTDPVDSKKLALNFDARLDPNKSATRLGGIGGLEPLTDIDVGIEAFLDERSIAQGGEGFLRITVNDKLVVDQWGPVLQQSVSRPYNWSVGMYLYSNTTPLDFDRFVYWKRARLISYD